MPQLMDERRTRGLEGCVRLHGARAYKEVSEMLQTAHIFLQHSVTAADGDQEGQGVSMMEAAATGLPVISTQHDGIPEVVLDGKTGFLVAEHDVEGMGERLANLAGDPGLWDELGTRGREHIEKNMQLEAQAESWRNLYKRVHQGDNCSS
jgi:colanic acid/amylovoran biosynthesis glycosyltransferase